MNAEITMMFRKGDRVILSAEGFRCLGDKQGRPLGTVKSTPQQNKQVLVIWDGYKSACYYANRFIELAPK